mmetsp:Transcript_116421/g.301761  ORF Transcript_116421/g.301761 Transcript_116421/m.301761 type:complete len:391 (+) Transcript_116421:470-1642(+)
MLGQQAWVHIDASAFPIAAKFWADNPHKSNKHHEVDAVIPECLCKFGIVLGPRGPLLAGHVDSGNALIPAALQDAGVALVGHRHNDSSVERAGLDRIKCGLRRAATCGPDDGYPCRSLDGPVADVTPAVQAERIRARGVKADAIDGLIGPAERLLEAGSLAGDSQDPTSAGGQTIVSLLRASVVNLYALDSLGFLKAMDRQALGVGARVTLRCADHGGSCACLPLDPFRDPSLQVALRAAKSNLKEVGLQKWQQDLRLRVPEAAIVLQQHGPVLCQHETAVQYPNVLATVRGHRLDGFLQDGLNLTPQPWREARCGCVGTHATCVRSLVMVIDTLMVLRRHHHAGNLAVGKGHATALLANKELLDDHLVTSIAEGFVDHDLLQRCLRLLH